MKAQYEQNHYGNADRIIDNYGHLIRFDSKSENWLIWKGTRWIALPDKERSVRRQLIPYVERLIKEHLIKDYEAQVLVNKDAANAITKHIKTTWATMHKTTEAI